MSGPVRDELFSGRSSPDRADRWMALRVDGRVHPSRGCISPEWGSREGCLKLYELVEGRTSGSVFRTADPALWPAMAHENGSRAASSTRRLSRHRGVFESEVARAERRRAKARGGLDGSMVIRGFGCLRIRIVDHPATRSAARSRLATPPRQKRGSEGEQLGGGVGDGFRSLLRGRAGARVARHEKRARAMPSYVLPDGGSRRRTEEGQQRGFDEGDEEWGSVLAGYPR